MGDRLGQDVPQTDLRIEERLGGGAGWDTYRVVSRSIGRAFCAKFVNPRVTSRPWREEVVTLGRLNHPHIVKLFRCVELEGEVIIVFDWAGGRPFEIVVEEDGPLPRPRLW